MTKRVWLALLLALALATGSLAAAQTAETTEILETAGTVETAETAEAASGEEAAPAAQEDQVILTVNGEPIMSSELQSVYQIYAQQYQAYGMDLTDVNNQQALVNMVINILFQDKLIQQKAAELGLDVFTQEEEQEIQDQAQSTYDQMLQMYLAYMSDESKTEDENRQAVAQQLEAMGYTVDTIAQNSRISQVSTRVYDYATQDVEIPEAAVQTAYDQGVEDAKARYAQDLTAYGTDLDSGDIVYYAPAGYRTVKHILVMFDQAKELKELRETLAALTPEDEQYAQTQAQIDEIMAQVQPKLDEIQQKIDAGEDFQTLIDEYGEDGGMKSGTTAQTGYYLCQGNTTFVPEFAQEGMALEKVGDVSQPVLTDYGFHIIRYNSDVPEGAVPYEDIHDAIQSQLLDEAMTAAYSSMINQWAQAAVIEYPQTSEATLEDISQEEPAPEEGALEEGSQEEVALEEASQEEVA